MREKIGTERRRCGESRLPGAGTALGRPTLGRGQGALVPVHIYRASCRGAQRTVRKLQRLLIKSKSAKLLAVRRVTQDNQGKRTAGIDGIKSLTPQQRQRPDETIGSRSEGQSGPAHLDT